MKEVPRYTLDLVEHRGGHYGEEMWSSMEMVRNDETGAWVKFADVKGVLEQCRAAGLNTPSV